MSHDSDKTASDKPGAIQCELSARDAHRYDYCLQTQF